jgi:hypothetical protein
MRMPHLEFIYRIVAEMDKGGVAPIEGVDSTEKTRLYLPIEGGTVHGPQIKGVIVHKSGADWAEVMNPKKVNNHSSTIGTKFSETNREISSRLFG